MIHDANAVIYQTREIWHSELSIAVAHCGELDGNAIQAFAQKNVSSLNICDGQYIASPKRLRGWFCKAAALVKSPFRHTLVVDLDVVWFKSPDVIFNSTSYQSTGSLFFRDRTTFSSMVRPKKEDKIFQDVIEEFIVAASKGKLNMTKELGIKKQVSDGHSFFWRNVANRTAAALNNFQDSSVIALDRLRHPRMLEVLIELIPSFGIGYGDKEIYWLAATIAEEPFSFEPFLCGLYGNCGLMMHFDPNDMADPANAKPLYLNGEWLLEKIHVLGHDLEFEHPKPVLVTENLPLVDPGVTRGCLCPVYGCAVMPEYVNKLLLKMQWERLSRGAHRTDPTQDCMPIYKPTAPLISQVVQEFIHENKCPAFGCVGVPILVNETFNWFSDSFCDPMYFTSTAPPGLQDLEKRAEMPPPLPTLEENELIRPGSSKTVYLVKNGTLHAFPDFHTFVVTGRDFSEVHVFADNVFSQLPVGPPLPNARWR